MVSEAEYSFKTFYFLKLIILLSFVNPDIQISGRFTHTSFKIRPIYGILFPEIKLKILCYTKNIISNIRFDEALDSMKDIFYKS